MVKHREKNTFHFLSFNDQLGNIKVGVRNLKKTDAEEPECNETQTHQSLQYWREINCSEQFVICYGKLNGKTESLAQLLHHKEQIVDIILETLQSSTEKTSPNTSTTLGCDAVLDVLSHLFLDLQQDVYPCIPRIVPVFQSLLLLQDAPLISNIFKSLGHIFKTTWRQMLADIPSVLDLLTPLLKPPTKHYVSSYAAQSVAYLIRKHSSPEEILDLLERKMKVEGDDMVKASGTLLFETIKGVQYKFNTFAQPYLTAIVHRTHDSKVLQGMYTELLRLIVVKITKSEVTIVWTGILSVLRKSVDELLSAGSEGKEAVGYIVHLLSCIDILVVGGRHTYMISSSDVWDVLSPICSALQNHQSLEVKFTETLYLMINAHNHLMRHLKDSHSNLDQHMLTEYIKHHSCLEPLKKLITKMSEIPEFFDKYRHILFDKLQSFPILTYSQVLADLVIICESQDILKIPVLKATDDFKKDLVNTISSTGNQEINFDLLKVLQCCGTLDKSLCAVLLQTFETIDWRKELNIYLETLKCVISGGMTSSGLISEDKRKALLEEITLILTENINNPVVLQSKYLLLKHCSSEEVKSLDVISIYKLLKENLMETSTTVRYLSLKIMSLLTQGDSAEAQHITAALSAETTPLSLETYRDKLMHCSQLRFSGPVESSEFRLRYLIGCLHWPLKPLWDGLTKLILEFASNDIPTFWGIFSTVLSSVYKANEEVTDPLSGDDGRINQYETLILNNDFSRSGLMLKDIKSNTFRVSLWNVLSEIPGIAEPKSKFLVPIILQFREKYEGVYGYRTQNIALMKESPSNESPKETGHMNNELRAMLKLLSQFKNPAALYLTGSLHDMHTELLTSKQSDVQSLALDCILTYKAKSLTDYSEELQLLVGDITFRDQLSKLSVVGEGSVLKEEDRASVFPVLLRIMFGKMSSRIGHAKGKSGSKQRQGVVLRYLEACSFEEVDLFFELIHQRFGINLLTTGSEMTLEITPLSMQTSYLRLLCQMLSVLREEQTLRYAEQITATVLTLLTCTQHCLAHRDSVQSHTITPLKALRSLSITTLTRVFNTFPQHDFSSLQSRVYDVVCDPSLPDLPSHSLQSCSPLLLFIESCATHRVSWLEHTYLGRRVLEFVVDLLSGKGVKNGVICKVLTIISTLIDIGEEGVTLLRPSIPSITDYIYKSLVALKKKAPDKKTLKQELHLLSQLSGLITDEPCEALVQSLVHVLRQKVVRRSGDVVNALATVTQLVVHLRDEALLSQCYAMCYDLLGTNADRYSRSAVCSLLERSGHPGAAILAKLHAWNSKVVDEPDFDIRLEGYREICELVRGAEVDEIVLKPCVYTALFTVFTSDEMALRDSASQALLVFIQHTTPEATLYSSVLTYCVAPAVQRALSNKSETFRREAVVLLHKIVLTFPQTAPWDQLAPLTDADAETDFFLNITHIQTHRRTRAVTRLGGLTDNVTPDVVWSYFIPLLYPVFSLKGNKYHNTVTEGLAALSSLVSHLPWSKFKKFLHRSLKELTADVENKVMVKVVGAILAGFHEEVLPGGKVLRNITFEIIPQLIKLLTKTSPMPERSNKKSIAYEQDQVSLQAPIGIAIVNLIMQLPEEERQSRLPPVLLRICNTLRSRSMEIRDVSRQTLSTISNSLGPLYLGYILSELRPALTKGYQLHVLSHTIHHLLLHMLLEPGQIDTGSLSILVEISVDGLVGRTAADRDRDDKKSSLPEAKHCYSNPILQICASKVAVSQLNALMTPVKKMVLETNKSKTRTALEEVLKGIVTGLLANDLFTPTVAMVFCHELLNESIELDKIDDKPVVSEAPKRPDIYEIPAAPKRDGTKPRIARLSDNSHMLRQLPLQLLTTLIKRKKISVKEHSGLLDPLIGSLTSLLSSPAVKTQVLAVKCFSQLFEQSVLLPSLCESVPQLTKFSFEILRNNSRSTNSGHMLELIFSSFKILTVILREYKDFSLSEVQTHTLLQYIADDIHNRNRQSTAFSLLKSILSRDLVHSEIPDLLARVLEMSIVGQSHFVRTQSRQVYLHYLLHYPLGKKLRPLFLSLTQQLEYTHKDGRLSALELIHALITKLPPDLLKEYFLVFFLSMSRMLVSDEEVECRRAVAVTVLDLMQRGDEALKEKVWSITGAWLSDSKIKHRYLAVQLIDILAGHVNEKKGAMFSEQLSRLVNTYCSSSEDSTATTLRDQVLYRSVVTLMKLKQPPHSVYTSLETLLLYPHQWVRLAAAQLLGHLISKLDPTSSDAMFPSDQLTGLVDCCIKQLHSPNLLPDHALQLTKNFVWFTSSLLSNPAQMSPAHLILKLVTCANVEASQNPGSFVKRSLVLKWVGALVASLPSDLILPHLPTLVVPINRELKSNPAAETSSSDVNTNELTNEVLNLLRSKLGNDAVSSALVSAEKSLTDKKRKRKREEALSAIAAPELLAKKKIKDNKAKREKRKEKYKTLKARQFKSF